MLLNVYMLLSFLLQPLDAQQKEGIGNLLAMGLLALFVVILIVVGIRYKNQSQQSQGKETVQIKETPLEASEAPSKKALR